MMSYVMSCREQDFVVVLAPYPNNLNPVESFNFKTDFDLTGDGLVWYARPQLFFNCTLCPTGLKATMHSGSNKEVSLVYFNTFEPIDLTPDSIMQRAGVPMLYDSASNPRLPCLYICPVANVLDAPPSFHASSAATVTPLSHTASRTIGVLNTPPPTHSGTRRLYKVNIWMWHRPRMVSIAEAERIRVKRLRKSRTRAAETRKRRSEAAAAAAAARGGGGVD